MQPEQRRESAADARSAVASAARELGHDLHVWTDVDLYRAASACRACGMTAEAGADVKGQPFGLGAATLRECDKVTVPR